MNIFNRCLLAAGLLLAGSAAGFADPLSIKVAYENNPGEPVDQVMHYWKDELEKKSNGEITLELFPSSQLGSKKDVTEQAMMGLNVITITDVGFLADYDPDLGVLFGPYLADDPSKLFKIYDGEWFKKKSDELKEKGIHIVMRNYLYGVRQLITKKPVRTPDDLKGMKIRVPNNNMQIKIFEAMGATPTPMPLGETFPALTQGVIDGVENPIAVLYGQKFHEEAKYLSKIGYLTNTAMFVGGEAFFSKIPADQLKLIEDTAYDAGLYSQKLTTDLDNQMIGKMKEAGVEVIDVDTAPFKALTEKVYTEFPEWTPGLYDQIKAELN
ncbi:MULTISPECIES: C4-dicarboxylate TRAP transporter substrate-binding protein [Phyllobacteriaceae]|uniref:DctP family TRAP transporter solute-binding subunit n=1 Tax=Ollibium composti TaxID=2675109 RepID=A0ABY2Q460_9HYPH|nr:MULTISPECIES: C4-dicarboxylate TRAP transporter substrate-binding protein [Mesorhizobium]QDC02395.1 DctP family TRAP transporter solute-binding subunit [Mesorhizobium sp. 8]THF54843.1 DctP family TRAP transporter solute-binding subunit [Mesorhizobium composti]